MHDSDSTECYVHVKHNILEDPGKHICMINLDRESDMSMLEWL